MSETKTAEPAAAPSRAVAPIDIVRLKLNAARDRFARALARKNIDPDEFIIGIMTQMNYTPKLLECTPESLILSAFRAAMVGLRIDGVSGHAFLVPRRRKVGEKRWIMEANFQIGYQGVLEHIYRNKDVRSIYPAVVREQDVWEPPRYSEQGVSFLHVPNLEDDQRGDIVAAYAKVKLVRDDEPLVFCLPIHQIYRDHRDVSQAYDSEDDDCPWIKYEEQMVLKTMIIVAGKYIPKSIHTVEIVSVADKLDKGIPVIIAGADDILDKPVHVSPDSLLKPDKGEVSGDNDANPDKEKRSLKEATQAETLTPERRTAAAKPVPSERRDPIAREPGDDDPEDAQVAGLFPSE